MSGHIWHKRVSISQSSSVKRGVAEQVVEARHRAPLAQGGITDVADPFGKKGGKACHRTSFGKRGVKHVTGHPWAPLASLGEACHRAPADVTELLSQQGGEAQHRAPSEKMGVTHVREQL